MKRIFFVCPEISSPSGGIKQIYRQVDILNKNNFSAFILHENKGFKCSWFDNDTQIAYSKKLFEELNSIKQIKKHTLKSRIKSALKKVRSFKLIKQKDVLINRNDIIVFPEVYGPRMMEVFEGIPKVIYNQGCYQTFFGYQINSKEEKTAYKHKDLIGVIVNSEDGKKYLEHAFPELIVHRIHYGFDSKKFEYSKQKKLQICLMPRRLKSDIIQVVNILKFRGVLSKWNIKLIEGMNEEQVATCMKESAIFLSFNINEGFGMPPAEAMACGCIVIGYTGKGGTEIFKNEFSYPIPDRDVQTFSKILEKVLMEYETNALPFLEKGRKASNFILSNYSLLVEEDDIVNTWRKLIQ